MKDELRGGVKKADHTRCFDCQCEIKGKPVYCIVSDFEPLCEECHDRKAFHICSSASPSVSKATRDLSLKYDGMRDILKIEGVRYAGDIFRKMGGMLPEGELFRLEKRENGVVTLKHERELDKKQRLTNQDM